MFTGGGLAFAESLLKDRQERHEGLIFIAPAEGTPDLRGFECRWHPIPSQRGQIVSLLVMSTEETLKQSTYAQIVKKVDQITGSSPHPLNTRSLNLSLQRADFSIEARLRSRALNSVLITLYQYFALLINTIGARLIKTKQKLSDFNGATYLDEVVMNTDYRKFDDTLRLTLDLNSEEFMALKVYLDDLHQQDRIVYGIHVSDSAQITCMVESHNQRHLHFIDGSNGGYASASVQLKRQLKEARATAKMPLEILPALPLPRDLYSVGSGPEPITERAI